MSDETNRLIEILSGETYQTHCYKYLLRIDFSFRHGNDPNRLHRSVVVVASTLNVVYFPFDKTVLYIYIKQDLISRKKKYSMCSVFVKKKKNIKFLKKETRQTLNGQAIV